MSKAPPRYIYIGLPTLLFSLVGLYSLTNFIDGTLKTRSLTRLTSKSVREDRLEQELKRAREKAFREEKPGDYTFGKRIERN